MSTLFASLFEAVFLCTRPKIPKMSRDQAIHYMKKSKAFVANRRRRMSQRINGLYSCLPRIYTLLSLLFSGQEQLKKKGLNISLDTIKRRLFVNRVKYRSTVKKPLLSEKHIEKRPHWTYENKDRDWVTIILPIKLHFRQLVWTTADKRLVVWTMKHPVKVHIWGCFSKKVFGNMHLLVNKWRRRWRKLTKKHYPSTPKSFLNSAIG